MPGSNLVPSGASLTIQSGGSFTAAAGSTITGIGGGNVSNSGTPTAGQKALWTDATHIQGVTDNALQWDGGASNLVAATGRTSLALNNVTNNAQTQAAIVPNTAPTAGQILAGNAGGTAYAPVTVSGSGATFTLGSTGVLTVSGIAPASISTGAGVGTWLTTPSSANLRAALTDENGTGAALFSGATTPDFTTGFTIGAAAASGKILIGNGTNFVPSTPTYPNASANVGKVIQSDSTNWVASTASFPSSAGTAGKVVISDGTNLVSSTTTFPNAAATALKWIRSDGTNWIASTSTLSDTPSTAGKVLISDGTNWTSSTPAYPTAAGTAGYTVRSDGTNFTSYPQDVLNSSTASQSPSTSDVYLTGSNCTVAAGDFKAKGQYRCLFDVTKTAGTGAIVLSVRVGTAGAIGDPAVLTYTFGAGTSVADTGIFEVIVTWRSVGSGTSAVVQGICRAEHNLATTGLFNNAAAWTIVATTSSGFASNTATNIGVSFNGSTAFAGTITSVQASLLQ